MRNKRVGTYYVGNYKFEKYFFASFITLGARRKVLIIVGITINAYALSTKLTAMSIEATEAITIIIM